MSDWKLDKKVSIAFLITFVGYAFGAIWFAAKIDSRVGSLEARTQNGITVFERLVKLETRFDGIEASISRIDINIEKLTDRQYNDDRQLKRISK